MPWPQRGQPQTGHNPQSALRASKLVTSACFLLFPLLASLQTDLAAARCRASWRAKSPMLRGASMSADSRRIASQIHDGGLLVYAPDGPALLEHGARNKLGLSPLRILDEKRLLCATRNRINAYE